MDCVTYADHADRLINGCLYYGHFLRQQADQPTGKKNQEIREIINKKYGKSYTINYISTIWTQKICGEIAEAARIHEQEFLLRDDEKAWKKCNTCGKLKLRNSDMFVKKAKAVDGLSNRCKICDRLAREKAKGGN